MKIGMSLNAAAASLLLVASVSACGSAQDNIELQSAPKAPVVALPSPATTDNAIAEAAAKAQADAAAAAAKAQADAAAAAAKAKAAAAAKAKAAAAAKAKAAAAAKAKGAAAAAAKAAPAPVSVYYANCAAVRAAGAAPIRIGEPGYSTKLDRDGDGIGCE